MSDFRVVIDDAAVARFEALYGAEVSEVIGPMLKRGAQNRAPVRSGKLMRSIDWQHVVGPDGGETVLSAVWYDLMLEMPAKQIKVPRRTLMDAVEYDLPRVL